MKFRRIIKNFLLSVLKNLARLTLARYNPRVIGITGSVGKTATKDAIFCVLSAKFKARRGEKSYNNEWGVPLTILGISSGGKSVLGWLSGLVAASARLVWTRYPKILILEMGVDKPKDMDYLLKIVRPEIVILTSMGEIPAHVENFAHREALVREKAKLALAAPRNGYVIYDQDSPDWFLFQGKIKANIITYGFLDKADIKIHIPEQRFAEEGDLPVPLGIAFKIEYKGSTVPFRLDNVFASSGAYPAVAACAVGIAFDMNLIEISSAFLNYVPPRGRMNLLEGVKNSLIFDDTYNSSPISLNSALKTLGEMRAGRKAAALGDMLELGEYTEGAHREAGRLAAKVCDLVFLVGDRMKFAEDELTAHGFRKNDNLFFFDDPEAAGAKLKEMVVPGDFVLVKGSQAMRMEKAVKEIMAHPERAEELLVRQEKEWF